MYLRTRPLTHRKVAERRPSSPATSSNSDGSPHRDQRRLPARTLLLLTFGISAAAFFTAVLWRAETDRVISDSRQDFEDRYRDRQTSLEHRVTDIAARDADQLAALEVRLRAVAAERSASAATAAALPEPFAIEGVVSSIGQLICLDNVQNDLFYSGSGTLVDERGFLVTNYHNLESSDGTIIRYCGVGFTANSEVPPSIDYVAAVRAVERENDLAYLQIIERVDGGRVPHAFPAIVIDAPGADALNLGDPLFIGGYPGIGEETFTYTQGVMSGRIGAYTIKTSALIDSGTSGGAAFDQRGRFIGVPTAAAAGEIGGSLGYLVSVEAVRALIAGFEKGMNIVPADRPLR